MFSIANSIFTRVLITFFTTLILVASYLIYEKYIQAELNIAREFKEKVYIDKIGIEKEIAELSFLTYTIAKLPAVKDFVDINKDKTILNNYFSEILNLKKNILQIRIIDISSGKELVRVEKSKKKDITIRQDFELQNKKNEIYYKEIKAMAENDQDEIYFSNTSLNREKNEIEIPEKLVTRSAKILKNSSGVAKSFVIINMSLNPILQAAIAISSSNTYLTQDFVLMDSDNNEILYDSATNLFSNKLRKSGKVLNICTLKIIDNLKNSACRYFKAEISFGNKKYNKQLSKIFYIKNSTYLSIVLDQVKNDLFLTSLILTILSIAYIFLFYQNLKPLKRVRDLLYKYSAHKSFKDSNEIDALTNTLEELTDTILHSNLSLTFQKKALDKAAIVAETDLNGIITYVNDKFCEVSGYERDELIGETHKLINSSFHPKSFFENMWITIKRGDTWHGVIQNKTKNGRYYWVDSCLVPFKNASGDIEKFIAIRFDVSKEFRQKKKLLKLNEELRKISYITSHDLKSPLVTIGGFSSRLLFELDGQLSDKHARYLDRINNNADYMNDLLTSLQNYTTSTKHKIFIKKNVSINELFQNVTEQMRVLIENTDTKVIMPKDDILINIDKIKFSQVLTNLLTNSIKYRSLERKSEITITTIKTSRKVKIVITDRGIGVNDKYLESIFDMFKRLDQNSQIDGNGIGLAICKEIISKLGGKIWAEPNKPFGLKIIIHLPEHIEEGYDEL